MAKSAHCSYGRPGFGSLHSHGSGQAFVIPVLGDPGISSGFAGTRYAWGGRQTLVHIFLSANYS